MAYVNIEIGAHKKQIEVSIPKRVEDTTAVVATENHLQCNTVLKLDEHKLLARKWNKPYQNLDRNLDCKFNLSLPFEAKLPHTDSIGVAKGWPGGGICLPVSLVFPAKCINI